MISIEDYCDSIDSNQPNFIDILIKKEQIKSGKKRVEDLNDEELEFYDALHLEHKQKYTKNWRYIIKSNNRYNNPSMANFEILDQL